MKNSEIRYLNINYNGEQKQIIIKKEYCNYSYNYKYFVQIQNTDFYLYVNTLVFKEKPLFNVSLKILDNLKNNGERVFLLESEYSISAQYNDPEMNWRIINKNLI